MRLFNHRAADNGAVLQHVLKIDKVAVMHMLCKIIRIVEVDYAFFVRLNNVLRQKDSSCEVL